MKPADRSFGIQRHTLATGSPAKTCSMALLSGSTSTWMAFQPGCSSMVCVMVPPQATVGAHRVSAKQTRIVKLRIGFNCSMSHSVGRVGRQRRWFAALARPGRQRRRGLYRFKNSLVNPERMTLLNIGKQLVFKRTGALAGQPVPYAVGHLFQGLDAAWLEGGQPHQVKSAWGFNHRGDSAGLFQTKSRFQHLVRPLIIALGRINQPAHHAALVT